MGDDKNDYFLVEKREDLEKLGKSGNLEGSILIKYLRIKKDNM